METLRQFGSYLQKSNYKCAIERYHYNNTMLWRYRIINANCTIGVVFDHYDQRTINAVIKSNTYSINVRLYHKHKDYYERYYSNLIKLHSYPLSTTVVGNTINFQYGSQVVATAIMTDTIISINGTGYCNDVVDYICQYYNRDAKHDITITTTDPMIARALSVQSLQSYNNLYARNFTRIRPVFKFSSQL